METSVFSESIGLTLEPLNVEKMAGAKYRGIVALWNSVILLVSLGMHAEDG